MKALIAFALAATFPAAALSATITVTFENPDSYFQRGNFVTGGLRFSPYCGQSAFPYTARSGSSRTWMASNQDNNNCDYLNEDFLGTGSPDFYVDRFGGEFTLLEIAGVGIWGTEFAVTSSKGGLFNASVPYLCCEPEIPYVTPYELFALSGPLWTDITWFTLFNTELVFHQSQQGWDDIRYSYRVAEPGTALLVGGGLAFLAITRRRRRSL